MNITTGLGLGAASTLSENTGSDEASMFIALNPLNPSVNIAGLSREVGFELPSLLNNSGDAQAEHSELEQPAVSLLLADSELTSAPVTEAIGDKKQALLTHLLNISETVPVVPSIHRAVTESLPVENVALAANPAAGVLTRDSGNLKPSVITPAAVKQTDQLMPVKPQFFAQALLNGDADSNEKSPADLMIKAFSPVIKNLSESGEGVKSMINQHGAQGSGTQNISNERQINWSPVKLRGSQEQMSEQLHSVLRERLQIQADSKVQQATIRLDPPSLGKIDIALHIEAGKLNIQINAAQTDVYRALQQMSNELRQHLTEQNFVQVNVQVSSDGSHQGDQGRRRDTFEEDPILTAQDIALFSSVDDKDGSILTTV